MIDVDFLCVASSSVLKFISPHSFLSQTCNHTISTVKQLVGVVNMAQIVFVGLHIAIKFKYHSRNVGMWCCVIGWALSGNLKDCSAFVFRVKQSQEVYSSWTAWPWRRKYYDPLKCWELLNQEHSWILVNSTMGTSNLVQDCGVVISQATKFKA